MPKTAGLYLVPRKSYAKNSHTHGLFGRAVVDYLSSWLNFLHFCQTIIVFLLRQKEDRRENLTVIIQRFFNKV
jgi:hypothetical protein